MMDELKFKRARRGNSAGRDSHEGEGRDRWLLSYADLVTLLFALFVVLYAAANHDRARAVMEGLAAQFGEAAPSRPDAGRGVLPGGDALDAERAMIERAFSASEALRARARATMTERGLVVSLAEAGFFAPGEASLREDARAPVEALADALSQSGAHVRVEGHTDSTPISTARYPSNWELSAARASAVLARLAARGIPTTRLSVAGYAGERPFADNTTPEGRALNRRVDLVILRPGD